MIAHCADLARKLENFRRRKIKPQKEPAFLACAMFEERLLVGVAAATSIVVLVSVLVVLPAFYEMLDQLNSEVVDGVLVHFRFQISRFRFFVSRPTPLGRR